MEDITYIKNLVIYTDQLVLSGSLGLDVHTAWVGIANAHSILHKAASCIPEKELDDIKPECRRTACENVKWVEELKIILNDGFVAAALHLHVLSQAN